MDRKIELPNVILLVMDAVRADHLSCYGYHRKTSPNIDNLAKKGVLFESAFSTAEWSYPSHASRAQRSEVYGSVDILLVPSEGKLKNKIQVWAYHRDKAS